MAILLIYFTNFLLPKATNASNMLPNSKNAPGSGTSETGGHFIIETVCEPLWSVD
jgi:hypothetical protein